MVPDDCELITLEENKFYDTTQNLISLRMIDCSKIEIAKK